MYGKYLGRKKSNINHKTEEKSIHFVALTAPLGRELLDCYLPGIEIYWMPGSHGQVTVVPAETTLLHVQ